MELSVPSQSVLQPEPALEIHHATLIHAEPERIYQALTTSEGLDAWFTQGTTVEARTGGHIHLRWINWGPYHVSAEDGGPVLEAIKPERFVFQWHPYHRTHPTTVEINIRLSAGGTIVSLREHGYPDTPSARLALVNCAAGWGEALTLLKFYLEYGVRYT